MDIDCFNLESGTLRGHAKSRARGTSHCICWSVSAATKVRRLRQRFEDCDKIAKRGANHGLISSIFRIDETSRGMRGLILRNNKTAFHLLECRFSGNPLYQPGIWTPSRTRRTRLRPYRELYQPGIWTPSRTLSEETNCSFNCINLGFGHLRGQKLIELLFVEDCINLGFDHLRGFGRRVGWWRFYCINLESGTKTRTRQSYSRCAKRL